MRGGLGNGLSLNFGLELASFDQLRLPTVVLHVNDVLQLRHQAITLCTVEDHLHGVVLLPRLHQLHPIFDSHHPRLW